VKDERRQKNIRISNEIMGRICLAGIHAYS